MVSTSNDYRGSTTHKIARRSSDSAVGSTTLAATVLSIGGDVLSEDDAVCSATLATAILGVLGDFDCRGSLVGAEGDGGEGVHCWLIWLVSWVGEAQGVGD